ncbi:MAG: FHA domain-containing protein, partial [Planctomycetales bacterium]
EVWVRDVFSNNGTFLNGDNIRGPRKVAPWDTLQVGSLVMEFHFQTPEHTDAEPSEVSDGVVARWLDDIADEDVEDAQTITRMSTEEESAAISDALSEFRSGSPT